MFLIWLDSTLPPGLTVELDGGVSAGLAFGAVFIAFLGYGIQRMWQQKARLELGIPESRAAERRLRALSTPPPPRSGACTGTESA